MSRSSISHHTGPQVRRTVPIQIANPAKNFERHRNDKGVLKINLAKKAEAKPKQIKVNIGSEKTLEGKAPGKAA